MSIAIVITIANRIVMIHSTADNANAPRTASKAHATRAATEKARSAT